MMGGLFEIAALEQEQPEAEMGIGEGRIPKDGAAESGFGLGLQALLVQKIGEHQPGRRFAGLEVHRAADAGQRLARAAEALEDESGVAPERGIARRQRQCRREGFRRGGEAARLPDHQAVAPQRVAGMGGVQLDGGEVGRLSPQPRTQRIDFAGTRHLERPGRQPRRGGSRSTSARQRLIVGYGETHGTGRLWPRAENASQAGGGLGRGSDRGTAPWGPSMRHNRPCVLSRAGEPRPTAQRVEHRKRRRPTSRTAGLPTERLAKARQCGDRFASSALAPSRLRELRPRRPAHHRLSRPCRASRASTRR